MGFRGFKGESVCKRIMSQKMGAISEDDDQNGKVVA